MDQLAEAYESARRDTQFQQELHELLSRYVGRPTPLYFARRLTDRVVFDGRNIYRRHQMERMGYTYYSVGRPAVTPNEAGRATTGATATRRP